MEIKLKKNGWHRRLQKYVFSYPPMFNNFCPYFWLTIYCIIVTFIIPVVPLWSVVKLFGLAFQGTLALLDKKICQPLFERIARNLSDEEIYSGWLIYNTPYNFVSDDERELLFEYYGDKIQGTDYKEKRKKEAAFQKWKHITPDWENKLDELRAKRMVELKQYYAERELKMAEIRRVNAEKQKKDEEREEWRRERFTRIVMRTQKIVPWVLSIVALGVLYYISKLFIWVYKIVNWKMVFYITKIVLVVCVALGLLIGLGYLIAKLITKCKIPAFKLPGLKYLIYSKYVLYPFMWIGQGLYWFFDRAIVPFCLAIGTFFSFVWAYILAIKENNCPHINWEDSEKERAESQQNP